MNDHHKSRGRELPPRLAELLNCAAILCPVGAGIPFAEQVINLSRSSIYRLLETGELNALKRGNRTLITWESLSAYLANLPTATFGKSAKSGEGQ